MPQARIGISGWTYGPWRGTFYPKGLAQRRELEWASRQVNSIEINGSFYSLQRPESYKAWYGQTPDDFIFSLKGSRFITHMKKLRDVEMPLANFFASGLLLLKEKLGPILWQFPPQFTFDAERLENFFRLLPRTTTEAAAMARHHDQRLKDRSWTRADRERPLRYAMEIRHESFLEPVFIDLLRRHRIALVVADTAGRWPYIEDLTADFVYLRLHGDKELYVSGYSDPALDRWTDRVKVWMTGGEPSDARHVSPESLRPCKSRDVYAYFDNDVKVRSPYDAIQLAGRLGIRPANEPGEPPEPHKALETPRRHWPAVRAPIVKPQNDQRSSKRISSGKKKRAT